MRTVSVLNILLVGPPGTGKTVALEDLRSLFEAKEEPDILFDPDVWDNAWSEGVRPVEIGLLPPDKERKVEPLVFHPSYGFEEFVAGLVPHVEEGATGIRLEARPGPLLSLARWAFSADRRALLIIDEFIWEVPSMGGTPGRVVAIGIGLFSYRAGSGDDELGERILSILDMKARDQTLRRP